MALYGAAAGRGAARGAVELDGELVLDVQARSRRYRLWREEAR